MTWFKPFQVAVTVGALWGGGGWVFSSSAQAVEAGPSEADKAEAKKHFEQGRRLFDLQRYADSIPEFEAAYQVMGDPAFLYNLAQACRLANRPEEAAHYYKTYLKRDPQTPRRAEVEKRIEELENAKAPPNQVTEPGQASPSPPAQPASPPPAEPAAWGATPPPAGQEPRPMPVMIPTQASERLSQGLMIQAELGFGAASIASSEFDVRLSGVAGLFSLRVGAFIRPGLGVFGQFSSSAITDPSVSGDGLGGNASGTLSVVGAGGGLIYYTPQNWFGSAALLFQQVSWDSTISQGSVSDSLGAALSLSVGREWSLGERWSGGVVGHFQAGGVPDNDLGAGAWTTVALCVGGIITYN